MTTFSDLLIGALDVFDAREERDFQRDMARIEAENEALMNAQELRHNINVDALQETLQDNALQIGGGLLAVSILVFFLVKGG
jgi:hypothetical protein